MTVVAAKKIVAVLIMRAVLLGAPIEPGVEAPAGGYAMSSWGAVSGYDQQGQEHMKIQADQVLLDANAGLVVAIGPSGPTVQSLFERHEGEDVAQALVRPNEDGALPPAALEFPWPKEGSAYYLEQIEPDLFRRMELATREGYEVSATFRGEDVVQVELELARRSFTGGDYEDSLDAWTERPVAVRSVVSTTVPLTEERPTLVVWRSPLQPTEGPSLQTGAAPAAGPPEWAVGTWRLETEHEGGRDIVPMIVRADGGGVISPDDEPMQIEVGATGHVSGQMVDGEATITLTGTLAQDGTGSGRVVARGGQTEKQMTWTATRVSGEVPGWAATGPAAGPPPEWAVGTWLVTAEGIEARMTIHEDGQGVIPFPKLPAHIRVDASGRVSTGEQLLPDVAVTVTGVLSADGTGSGVLCGSHGDEQAQVQWTATKITDEASEDDQASTTSSAPIRLAQLGGGSFGGGHGGYGSGSRGYRDENMRPMGLAVLLELRRWVYEPASQEMRREFEPLARALEQTTGGRARLDLQQTQTPTGGQLTVVPIVVDGAAQMTVEDEEYVPVLGLRLADIGSAEYFYRDERGTDEQRTVSYDRDVLRFPAGASLLAQPSQGAGKMIVLVPGEDGLARPPKETAETGGASYGIGRGFGSAPESATPLEGAPDLPFAEAAGWGRSASWGGPAFRGPEFELWGPAVAGDDARVTVEIVVRAEDAPAGGGFGGSSYGGSGSGSGSSRGGTSN